MQNQIQMKIFTTEITEHTEIDFFKKYFSLWSLSALW